MSEDMKTIIEKKVNEITSEAEAKKKEVSAVFDAKKEEVIAELDAKKAEMMAEIEAKVDEKLNELQENINKVEINPPWIPNAMTELSAEDVAVASDNVKDFMKATENLEVEPPVCVPGPMENIRPGDVEFVSNVSNAVKEEIDSTEE